MTDQAGESGYGADQRPSGGSSVTIVTSDCSRNGKTLFAKLVTDLLVLRNGVVPHVFDTDNPDGSLAAHFPDHSRIIDLVRTDQQIALFDGVLAEPGGQFVVDLAARHLKRFFAIYRDIEFEREAVLSHVDVAVYYLIDRTEASVATVAQLASNFPSTQFIPVRNAAIGDALDNPHVADVFRRMKKEREILLPELSAEALGMMEHPDFHFDQFVAGHYDHFPYELKAELWEFLETLYAQRESSGERTIQPL